MVYQSSSDKAKENHSTGWMLIIVGGLGFVGDIIFFMMNPMNMPMFNRYLSCGVMGALFVLFFVMGILSVRTYKIFSVKAKEEDNVLRQIRDWCESELSKEVIEEDIASVGEDESVFSGEGTMYFKRCEYIKNRIRRQYMNLNEDMLDSFVDEYYTQVYGDET
ncbi:MULTISPECIES: hypothetical protein [unclassified Butyrivibrio]|jgi:hypothetical protein|uniref:hypothetical protein n=1 Tax=unclassified Butyrivibrio TaxID=2639466 RepID=UPI00040C72D4|nr:MULTISPECIES: hypothetical protein [unclassified Butyrivibrio]